MPLIDESHDSLPYIDADLTERERERANKLISAELPPNYQTILHSSMPPAYEPAFTQLFQRDIERKAAGRPFSGGVDLSRYEAPEEPSDERNIDAWRATLKKAYTSGSYLSGRLANLSLLEEYGKNAWLISNSQLEGLLKQLEMELAEVKQSTENINKARKTAQEGSKAELVGLQETWRRSVGRIIEVQVATDGLRREILARRRLSAR